MNQNATTSRSISIQTKGERRSEWQPKRKSTEAAWKDKWLTIQLKEHQLNN